MTEKEILLTSILNCSRSMLYSQTWSLNVTQEKMLSEALSLRAQGMPLQYIIGETEFFGLRFKVDKRVLIPRPETELLVEAVIRSMEGEGPRTKDEGRRILDIGTGSGCIAVSLAKALPQAAITALDISFDALSLAKENAMLHSVDHRIRFIQCDLLSSFGSRPSAYDLIISNPPYVCSADIKKLQPEVQHEPTVALDGGSDGLDFYRRLIPESARFLRKGGLLFLEIGFEQRKSIERIIAKQNVLELKEVTNDYSGIERVMVLEHG